MKTLLRLIGMGLGLSVVAAAVLGGMVLHWLEQPLGTDSEQVQVRVERGMTPRAVCDLLAEKGVLSEPDRFYTYLRVKKAGGAIQAGNFLLRRDLKPAELLEALSHGMGRTVRVTVPEGFRYTQIAERLAAEGLFSRDEFLALFEDKALLERYGIPSTTLEGYLFPDTYELDLSYSPRQVAERMIERWREVWDSGIGEQASAQGRDTQWVMTLASIVEKETGLSSERPDIAGVFLRRLEQDWLLQTDPTVIYGIRDYDGDIRYKDLRDPHPWNTYVHKGLPPTPICSPGRAAMEAVLNPTPGKTMFFVSKNDGTGAHDFSVTNAEHERKVRKYLLNRR